MRDGKTYRSYRREKAKEASREHKVPLFYVWPDFRDTKVVEKLRPVIHLTKRYDIKKLEQETTVDAE